MAEQGYFHMICDAMYRVSGHIRIITYIVYTIVLLVFYQCLTLCIIFTHCFFFLNYYFSMYSYIIVQPLSYYIIHTKYHINKPLKIQYTIQLCIIVQQYSHCHIFSMYNIQTSLAPDDPVAPGPDSFAGSIGRQGLVARSRTLGDVMGTQLDVVDVK